MLVSFNFELIRYMISAVLCPVELTCAIMGTVTKPDRHSLSGPVARPASVSENLLDPRAGVRRPRKEGT